MALRTNRSSNNIFALHHTLRINLSKRARDTVLSSPLASGRAPLSVLDVRAHTLVIYQGSLEVAGWCRFRGRRQVGQCLALHECCSRG